jgi:transcriptional regulator with XRE-family HTH domain
MAEGRRQSWLAREVGIDQADLSRIANRGLIPSDEVQQKIAEALGRTVDELWPSQERSAA